MAKCAQATKTMGPLTLQEIYMICWKKNAFLKPNPSNETVNNKNAHMNRYMYSLCQSY